MNRAAQPESWASPPARVWLWSLLLWGAVAALASTHQWVDLRGTEKEVTWFAAFTWQGVSWLLLAPATPLLFRVVGRRPLDRRHPRRTLWHACASVGFGVLFLAVATPVRLAFHPSPLRWSFFGEAFYKSIPQFVGLGALTYWAVVLVASLVETRSRLYGTLALPPADDAPGAANGDGDTQNDRLLLSTPGGVAQLRTQDVAWAEPARSGARLHTRDGAVLVRHSLADLEEMLAAHGFARSHRGCLVNAQRVRELLGSPSRDGVLRLDTGQTLPVSRRRHAALAEALGGAAGGG